MKHRPKPSHTLRHAPLERLEERTLLSGSFLDHWDPLVRAAWARYTDPPAPALDVPALSAQPQTVVQAKSLAGPAGYAPEQLRLAYGLDANNGGVISPLVGDGTGQTIAIVDAYHDPNLAGDLATFDAQFGLPTANLVEVGQTGGSVSGLSSNSSWALEASLDVQWAHAMAPGAKLLLVEANSANLSDLLAAADYAKTHAAVVSMSWGTTEFRGETSNDKHFTQANVTFVASSGDSGGVVNWPAVSPYVVGVGGTSLTLNADNTIQSETGWSGSGGGISQFESKPSYQQYVTLSNRKRTSPDVAWNGDPNTGYSVYDSFSYGGWVQVGGTSAGAPQWAAMVAIADQSRVSAGKTTLGGSATTLPTLYNLAHTSPSTYFHDIVSGTAGSFSAGPGYDLITGNGSPIANAIIGGLAKA